MFTFRCRDAPANSVFSGPVTSSFKAIRFGESPFLSLASEKKRKRKKEMLKGFKFRIFSAHFMRHRGSEEVK